MKKLYILLIALFCLVGCGPKLNPELAANVIYTTETEQIQKTIQKLNSFNGDKKVLSINIDSIKITFPEEPMTADMYTTWIVSTKEYNWIRHDWEWKEETIPVIIEIDNITRMIWRNPDYIQWNSDWLSAKYFVF